MQDVNKQYKNIIDVVNTLDDQTFINLFKLIQDTDIQKLIEALNIEANKTNTTEEKEEIQQTITALKILENIKI